MSLDSPKVTVVMPVYNGERYLELAIESILNQTFRDFEFIIIDDGSTDGTADILGRYQELDNRIRVYQQENQGVTASRNRGCHFARGKYIAVMDADDISLPERLQKQLDHMEAHPEIGILGTVVDVIDENGRLVRNFPVPTAPSVIRWYLLFQNPLTQSSIMMRRDVIEPLGFYNPEVLMAEDYDLWTRASLVTRLATIQESLLLHRAWEGGISLRHSQTNEKYAVKVARSMITRLLGYEVPAETVATLRRPVRGSSSYGLQQIENAAKLLQRIYIAFSKTNSLSHMEAREISHHAGERLYALALSARRLSLWKGFVIYIQALRLNPRLLATLSRQIIAKGVRTLLRRA